MTIDEKHENPLTNYNRFKRTHKITESDHNKLELVLNIQVPFVLPQREELFNFKSSLGQQNFFELTSHSEKLRNSFKSDGEFLPQAALFENTLKGIFHQSFQKIRGIKRKKDKSEVDELIEKRKQLKISIENTQNSPAVNELENIDYNIATIISNKNRDRVNSILQNIANTDNSCNTQGMLKQIKK